MNIKTFTNNIHMSLLRCYKNHDLCSDRLRPPFHLEVVCVMIRTLHYYTYTSYDNVILTNNKPQTKQRRFHRQQTGYYRLVARHQNARHFDCRQLRGLASATGWQLHKPTNTNPMFSVQPNRGKVLTTLLR